MSAGALTETLACAVRAVGLAGIGSGDRVLIFGAGPIGLGCLLVARELGASVVVSDLSEGRLAIARSWGAAHVIPAATSDLVSTVKELVPDGIHRSIDAVGAARTRADSLRAVVPGGRAVWIGLHEEESSLPAHILIRNEISVTGSFAYANADFERALELQQRGLFAPAADWLEERPLEAGADAFAELVEGKARAAKILLRVG
jgi:threonine dehydrogenase-like Zn-dependent dehydrogenase